MAGRRSEKTKDIFGNEYIQHYDERGLPAGRSEVRERFFGGTYIQHYDEKGRPIGTSEEQERFFGGKYTQHYDEKGRPVGTSEEQERFFGGKYTQHYDGKGRPIGTSEEHEKFFGGKYTQHSGTVHGASHSSFNSSTSSTSGSSAGNYSGYSNSSSSGYSGGYVNDKPRGFYVSFDLGLAENWGILFITTAIMIFATRYLYQVYVAQPILFYQVISVYATVSSVICLLTLHKKHKSKGAGRIAIWLMALANGMVLMYETQLLSALLYPGSVYHVGDFFRTIRFWIPMVIHAFILGVITVMALRKTDDQKLYIRKVSAGFRVHAICSYSAIYAMIVYMADTIGDTAGWFGRITEGIIVLIFVGVLTSIAIFVSNLPYLIFCKYSEY